MKTLFSIKMKGKIHDGFGAGNEAKPLKSQAQPQSHPPFPTGIKPLLRLLYEHE